MNVVMYTTAFCPYCIMAERMLPPPGGKPPDNIRDHLAPARRAEILSKSARRTVPPIFIGSVHVGGYDDLVNLDRNDELTRLLAV